MCSPVVISNNRICLSSYPATKRGIVGWDTNAFIWPVDVEASTKCHDYQQRKKQKVPSILPLLLMKNFNFCRAFPVSTSNSLITALRYATAIAFKSVLTDSNAVIAMGASWSCPVPLYPQLSFSPPGAPAVRELTSHTITLPSAPEETRTVSFRSRIKSQTASECPTNVNRCKELNGAYVLTWMDGKRHMRIDASSEAEYSNCLPEEMASRVIGAEWPRSVIWGSYSVLAALGR